MKSGVVSMDHPSIPKNFTDDVYRRLEGFDSLLFFQWDIASDTVILNSSCETIPYDFPGRQFQNPREVLMQGLLYAGDHLLLKNFFQRLEQEGRHVNPVRGEAEVRLRSANHEDYFWVETKYLAYFEGDEAAMIFGSVRNIDQRKKRQLRLVHEAEHDTLTGLLNKQALQQHAEEYLSHLAAEAKESALLLIDADGFKDINDSMGHLFGDKVLAEMAKAIQHHFRNTEIIGRIGGDEFVVLFHDLPPEDLLRDRCQSLIDDIRCTYHAEHKDLPFSICIGVALCPSHGRTYEELFTHADRALYEAKRRGKSTFRIYRTSFLSAEGDVPSRTSGDDAEYQQKMFRDNMLEYIFQLLYELKSPEDVIRVSLRMLCQRFAVDLVAVLLNGRTDNSIHAAYVFRSPNGISYQAGTADLQATELCTQTVAANYRATQWGTVSTCSDTSLLSEEQAAAFRKFKIRAFASIKIMRIDQELGAFWMGIAEKPHEFRNEEMHAMNVFASLLGNVLLDKESDADILRQNKRLIEVIDHMQEMIYVVDKDTYELLFFNQTIRQAIPEAFTRQTCYYRFHRFEAPCPNCPLASLSDAGAEYIVRTVDSWGAPFVTKAFNIAWEKGRRTGLIIMET